jgi:vacuolar-type H+-ATPase subunit H
MSTEFIGIIILSIVLAVVLFAYERLLEEVRKLKSERETVEVKSRQKAAKLVNDAREKAVTIVGEAKIDAQKWQEVLNQELDKLVQSEVGEYKQRIQSISNNIEDQVRSEAEDFKKVLEMETVDAQRVISEQMKEKYDTVEKQVEEYRQKKFKEIDEKAAEVLETAAKEVFGKLINLESHTDLIIAALEKAKKQNVI